MSWLSTLVHREGAKCRISWTSARNRAVEELRDQSSKRGGLHSEPARVWKCTMIFTNCRSSGKGCQLSWEGRWLWWGSRKGHRSQGFIGSFRWILSWRGWSSVWYARPLRLDWHWKIAHKRQYCRTLCILLAIIILFLRSQSGKDWGAGWLLFVFPPWSRYQPGYSEEYFVEVLSVLRLFFCAGRVTHLLAVDAVVHQFKNTNNKISWSMISILPLSILWFVHWIEVRVVQGLFGSYSRGGLVGQHLL